MSLIEALSQYGYLAVLIGSLFEGETILILAGFTAYQNYLSFPLVIVLAFCGGTIGDQIFFFLGRHQGSRILSRFPRILSRAQFVNQLILRYHTSLIIGIRFMYGFRIIGPCIIGMSDVRTNRFILFNIIGALLWSILFVGAGYLCGNALQSLIPDLKQYEEIVLLFIVVAAFLIGLVRHLLIVSSSSR